MLPKEYRLPKQTISSVFSNGTKIGTREFLIQYTPSSESTSRFCIIMRGGKKSTAVERNRTARLARISLIKHVSSLPISIDAIILILPFGKTVPYIYVDDIIKKVFFNIASRQTA